MQFSFFEIFFEVEFILEPLCSIVLETQFVNVITQLNIFLIMELNVIQYKNK